MGACICNDHVILCFHSVKGDALKSMCMMWFVYIHFGYTPSVHHNVCTFCTVIHKNYIYHAANHSHHDFNHFDNTSTQTFSSEMLQGASVDCHACRSQNMLLVWEYTLNTFVILHIYKY